MPLTVTIEHEGYERGAKLDVGGLLLVNGEATEVSDEAAAFFKARHGSSVRDHFSGKSHVSVSGEVNENYDSRDAERKKEELAAFNEATKPGVFTSPEDTTTKTKEEGGE